MNKYLNDYCEGAIYGDCGNLRKRIVHLLRLPRSARNDDDDLTPRHCERSPLGRVWQPHEAESYISQDCHAPLAMTAGITLVS